MKPCLETEGVPEAQGMDNAELELKQEQHSMRHCVEAMAPERRAEPKLEVIATVKREVKRERCAVQQHRKPSAQLKANLKVKQEPKLEVKDEASKGIPC
eukprot:1540282-Heterocapsa_arctica.AAC.1